jgi:hypothetical protein
MAGKRPGRAAAGWTQLRLEEPAPAERPPPAERSMPASEGEFIAALVADLVTELGDALHTVAHQEAVAVLWRRSGLPEAQFAKVLWEVRGRLKRRPAPRQGGAGPVRVAAFFVLLRDRLGLVEEGESGTPAARPVRPPSFLRER